MKSIPPRLLITSLFSAILQLAPFPIAGAVPFWRRCFCWFCLAPLLYALSGKDRSGKPLTLLQTTLVGYFSGVAFYLGNCYWIYQTMHIYGDIPELLSFGILILFALYLGLYHALFAAAFSLLRRGFSVKLAILFSPLLWAAVELARARVTGFPGTCSVIHRLRMCCLRVWLLSGE